MPVDAYTMFPSLLARKSGDFNLLSGEWIGGTNNRKINFKYKYYLQPSHSSAEVRLTAFRSSELNKSRPRDLLILAKVTNSYELYFIPRHHLHYDQILAEMGLINSPQGTFFYDLEWEYNEPAISSSPELLELLAEFDKVKDMYHPTCSASDKGVGMTFEKLLGISENNLSIGDYKGIEINCSKLKNGLMTDQDLFLKSPLNLGGYNNKKMINDFGYLDEKGRQALKISVSTLPNRQDFRLLVDDKNKRIILAADHVQVAYWSFSQIEKRLNEKLNDTVFIGAVASGSGRNERFSYKTLTFCGNPSAKAFSQLVKERVISLELRMHLEPNGKLRDHGYQFRIKSSRLISLFSKHIQFR